MCSVPCAPRCNNRQGGQRREGLFPFHQPLNDFVPVMPIRTALETLLRLVCLQGLFAVRTGLSNESPKKRDVLGYPGICRQEATSGSLFEPHDCITRLSLLSKPFYLHLDFE